MKLVFIMMLLLGLLGNAFAQTKGHIIVFKKNVDAHDGAVELERLFGLKANRVYSHALSGVFINKDLPEKMLNALSKNPHIAYIEKNGIMKKIAQSTPVGMDRVDVEQVVMLDGVDDRVDIDVAILDTGISSTHPDLRINKSMSIAFNEVYSGPPRDRGLKSSRLESDWNDRDGHGTHCAGTVAAIDNNSGVVGVAPGARVTAVKVLDDSGSGTIAMVVAGIDYVAANADTFAVANMSLGGGYSQSINDAVKRATEAGVVMVVAAGNESSDAATKSPASEPSAITVSAMVDTDGKPGALGSSTSYGNDDTLASFSNYGAIIDIAAPGVNILSTYLDGQYAYSSGTSMASPHVAGAVALYLAHNGRDFDANGIVDGRDVAAVESALKTSGWKEGDTQYFSNDVDTYRESLLNVGTLISTIVTPPPAEDYAPTADAGSDQVVIDVNEDGVEVVTLSGSGSSDDNGIVSYDWYKDGNLVASGVEVNFQLALGAHTFTLIVTDSIGQTAQDSVTINVESQPVLGTVSSVESVVFKTSGGKTGDKNFDAIAKIVDSESAEVAGAVIESELYFEGVLIGSSRVQSDSLGQATLFKVRGTNNGCYNVVIKNVTVNGLDWDGIIPENKFCK